MIMNNASMNILVQVFVWLYVFHSLRYIIKNGIDGPYVNFRFNFLRKCQTVFHSSYTIYMWEHSWIHEQFSAIWMFQFLHIITNTCYTQSFSLQLSLCIWIWCLILDLIYISLIMNDIVHLFMCLITLSKSSLKKC